MNPTMPGTGLVSITFRQLSPRRIVELVKEAKLDAIEWGGDVHVPHGDYARAREVRTMTRDAGLAVAAYGSYYRAGISEQDGLPFAKVLETAKELGAPTIRVWAGNKGSSETTSDQRQQVLDDIQRTTDLASRNGLSISLEYHPNTLTDTIESARVLLDAIPDGNLHTLWQPPHEESVDHCLASLRSVLDRLSNVHVFHWQLSPRQRRALSEGADRWRAYLGLLRADPRPRHLLLEFVKDDSAEQFLKDAGVLKEWINSAVASHRPLPT